MAYFKSLTYSVRWETPTLLGDISNYKKHETSPDESKKKYIYWTYRTATLNSAIIFRHLLQNILINFTWYWTHKVKKYVRRLTNILSQTLTWKYSEGAEIWSWIPRFLAMTITRKTSQKHYCLNFNGYIPLRYEYIKYEYEVWQ
jgi:hypothetical protein